MSRLRVVAYGGDVQSTALLGSTCSATCNSVLCSAGSRSACRAPPACLGHCSPPWSSAAPDSAGPCLSQGWPVVCGRARSYSHHVSAWSFEQR